MAKRQSDDVELLDKLKCPVCKQVPENEVRQCVNGHIACQRCTLTLDKCAECDEVNLGGRHRAVEFLLDDYQFDCSNAALGCEEKLTRQAIENHAIVCDFKPSAQVQLGQLMGLEECKFVISRKKPAHLAYFEMKRHLLTHHGMMNKFCLGYNLTSRLDGFPTFGDSKFGGTWLMRLESFRSILVIARIHGVARQFTLLPIVFNDDVPQEPMMAKFRIKSKCEKVEDLCLNATLSHYRDSSNILANSQQHAISVRLLTEHYVTEENSLTICMSPFSPFYYENGDSGSDMAIPATRISPGVVPSPTQLDLLSRGGCQECLREISGAEGHYVCRQCQECICGSCMQKGFHPHPELAPVDGSKKPRTG